MKHKFNNPKYFDSDHPEQDVCNTLNEFLHYLGEVATVEYPTVMGYPCTENRNMQGFYDWYLSSGMCHVFLNNAGNPFDESPFKNSTLQVERKLLEYLAPFYGINRDNVWGIVTASGTDGNNHGLYFGAQKLRQQTGQLPVVYVSEESHYSNKRLCDLQNLEVRLIDCDQMGRMKPDALRQALDPKRPVLVIYSMGSTFKGAIDDQQALNEVIDEVDPIAVYRHVDAALFGGYLPFTEWRDLVDMNRQNFQSIAVSGHKFFGIDVPCGLFITTKSVMEYQKNYRVGYLNGEMPMINCSRSSMTPIKFFWVIENVGREGLAHQARLMLQRAQYMLDELRKIGWPAWKNDQSNTVFFRRPPEEIVRKYGLARGHDTSLGGDLAHAVMMQQINEQLIDQFVGELKQATIDD